MFATHRHLVYVIDYSSFAIACLHRHKWGLHPLQDILLFEWYRVVPNITYFNVVSMKICKFFLLGFYMVLLYCRCDDLKLQGKMWFWWRVVVLTRRQSWLHALTACGHHHKGDKLQEISLSFLSMQRPTPLWVKPKWETNGMGKWRGWKILRTTVHSFHVKVGGKWESQ